MLGNYVPKVGVLGYTDCVVDPEDAALISMVCMFETELMVLTWYQA